MNFICIGSICIWTEDYLFGENKHLDDDLSLWFGFQRSIYIPNLIAHLKLQKQKPALALKFIFIKFVCFVLDSMSMDLFTDW